jgi:HD superfamily phosphohydrolase YqeK
MTPPASPDSPVPRRTSAYTRLYIAAIAALAASAVAVLSTVGPAPTWRGAFTAAFLCIVGWAGSRFTYEVDAKGAHGSVGYLLFPAAGLAVADWTVPLAVGLTMLTLELARGAAPSKRALNVAVAVLGSGASILVYQAAGGTAWSTRAGHENVAAMALSTALPAALLLITSRMTNSVAVSGVLAIAQGQRFWRTLRVLVERTAVDDVVVSPLVALFAYAAVSWGVVPTLVTGASLIGVQRLYQTNIAMQHLNRQLLEMMVSAIEARDPYTSGHSRRVAAMAVVIARALGRPAKEVERIRVAGLMHDVGKIHERYAAILQKPDKLTKDEWLLMQQHPADGEAIVSKVSQLHDILPAVRHHHEKWDGSGYPDGLKGEEIPFAARVLTVADTIDAMTSDRPYRRGLTRDEVRVELEKWTGKQFDPAIVLKLLEGPYWESLFATVETNGTRYGLTLVVPEVGNA